MGQQKKSPNENSLHFAYVAIHTYHSLVLCVSWIQVTGYCGNNIRLPKCFSTIVPRLTINLSLYCIHFEPMLISMSHNMSITNQTPLKEIRASNSLDVQIAALCVVQFIHPALIGHLLEFSSQDGVWRLAQ